MCIAIIYSSTCIKNRCRWISITCMCVPSHAASYRCHEASVTDYSHDDDGCGGHIASYHIVYICSCVYVWNVR